MKIRNFRNGHGKIYGVVYLDDGTSFVLSGVRELKKAKPLRIVLVDEVGNDRKTLSEEETLEFCELCAAAKLEPELHDS